MATNLLQDGADWLGERLKESAGRSMSYTQGNTTLATVTGVPSAKIYHSFDNGAETLVHSLDWIVSADDVALTPRPGDRITETLGGVEYIYEVMPIDDDRPCCEWHDNARKLLLIHTKRVQ